MKAALAGLVVLGIASTAMAGGHGHGGWGGHHGGWGSSLSIALGFGDGLNSFSIGYAGGRHWGPAFGFGYSYAAPPVYVAPPPVIYAPPPVVYAPPVVYSRPAVVVAPAPVVVAPPIVYGGCGPYYRSGVYVSGSYYR